MKTVRATYEGLVGHRTSSGYVIDRAVAFVALPSTRALFRFVRVTNPRNHRTTLAQVLDVGPWNEHDDAYVFGQARPLAETGRDTRGRFTNRAGIDLGDHVRSVLGITDNQDVIWEFVG